MKAGAWTGRGLAFGPSSAARVLAGVVDARSAPTPRLALRFKHVTVYLETARECFEAYVIYNFYKLMERWIAVDHRMLVEKMRAHPKKTAHHLFPFCWLPEWRLSSYVPRAACGCASPMFAP